MRSVDIGLQAVWPIKCWTADAIHDVIVGLRLGSQGFAHGSMTLTAAEVLYQMLPVWSERSRNWSDLAQ